MLAIKIMVWIKAVMKLFLRKAGHFRCLQTCFASCLCHLQYEMNNKLQLNINTREIIIIMVIMVIIKTMTMTMLLLK